MFVGKRTTNADNHTVRDEVSQRYSHLYIIIASQSKLVGDLTCYAVLTLIEYVTEAERSQTM